MLSTLRTHRYSPGRNWFSLAFSLLLIDVTASIFLYNESTVADYNHFLEMMQASVLLLAVGMHGERALRVSRSSNDFLVHAALMWLCCAFLLREIDIDRLGADPAWTWAWVWLERGLRAIALALLLVLLMVVTLKIRQVFAARVAILSTPIVVLTMAGGVFLVAGWPFDKNMFPFLSSGISAFIEELLELNGYLLVLAGSLASAANAGTAHSHE
jgi:hypothetical protein